MEQLKTTGSRDDVLDGVRHFSLAVKKVIAAMLAADFEEGGTDLIDGGIRADRKFLASILFTGTAYGEYVLAMDEDVAIRLLEKINPGASDRSLDESRRQMAATFSEIINIAVGESILSLGETCKKLTITAPRVYFGRLEYPHVKTARARLKSPLGELDCYLYIDRMKLDIASSYSHALGSLVQAHKELRAAMERLQTQQAILIQTEKMAALGTMAAGVAHEINTPLATVSMIGSQLKDMMQDPAVDRSSFIEMLDIIDKTVSRIAKITNGLRGFAHGVQRDTFSVCAVKEVVEDTLVFCEHHVRTKGIRIVRETLSDSLQIECRLPEISQVLLNLIMNSCDAVEDLPEKWIQIEAKDLETSVEIAVTDSGHGISEDIRSKLFDPFFTTKAVGKGTGLGLSISKGIIEEHGGSLGVDPTSPQTRFIMRLPKTQSPASVSKGIKAS